MSAPVVARAPATATAMRTRSAGQPAPLADRDEALPRMGWVATSAVAVATDVSFVLGTQVAKWAARATPAHAEEPARAG
jgi:hypothetical protein